jgi:hypothetical protein
MAVVFQYKLASHTPGSTATTGNASSGGASFSSNGRYVLFDSMASNFAGSDSNAASDLFLYDTQDFSVDLVSHIPSSLTTAANGPTGAARAIFSVDSRYVLFDSTASNLTGSDVNAASDLFLYDTQNGSVTLVSHVPGSTTTTGNGATDATRAFFSPDGDWVLFDSIASDLASGDVNGSTDVFLYNTLGTSVTLVSHANGSLSTTANGQSTSRAFSPDGHNLLFASRATNLLSTPITPNGNWNLFLFTVEDQAPFAAGQITLVSHTANSTTTSGSNSSAVNVATFSPDGRYVLFDSLANNLVSGQADTNGVADLFLYDTQSNSSALVSHIPGSTTTSGSGATFGTYPAGAIFSPNGHYVLFKSDASNLAASDANASSDLFLYDTQNGSVTLVSHIAGSTTSTANGGSGVNTMAFSPDSRYVLFDSLASNLVGPDGNANLDLFLYDTQDGSVDLVSHAEGLSTTTGNGGSSTVAQPFSQNSRYVLFNSFASNLVATDGNGAEDAFLYDTLDGSVWLVSASAGGAAANGTSIATGFGPGGSLVIQSTATNLGGLAFAELNNDFDVFFVSFANVAALNPPPPAATTADMILRHGADGQYEIYDIGNNGILAAYQLGQVGTDWKFVGLGRFFSSDTTDMLLRSSGTGGFEVYDISNNNISNAAFLGTVGLNWQAAGFGDFNHDSMTDLVLRNSSTGGFEVYNISNNQIIGANFMGTVGLDWQVGGFGNFSSRGETDMILRNTGTGGLEVYNISSNQITNAAFMGTVGLEWQIIGVGNFSSMPGESDVIMRNVNTGGLEVYNVANNQITGAAFLARLDWIGNSQASPRSTPLVHPTWCCATSTLAHSRFTTSPTIKSPEPRSWVRSDWIGSLAASPSILRVRMAQPLSSCRPWPVSAAVQPTPRIPSLSMPDHSSRF